MGSEDVVVAMNIEFLRPTSHGIKIDYPRQIFTL